MFSDAISVEDALLQRDTRVLIGMQEFSDTTRCSPLAGMPTPQPPLQVVDRGTWRRFLCSFDRTTCIGRRDYAICFHQGNRTGHGHRTRKLLFSNSSRGCF